jgi:hypothetical protein
MPHVGTLRRLVEAFEEGFFPGRRLRRELRRAPALPLSQLPEGVLARITGLVRPAGATLIEAPISGRLCVYYRATVVEIQHGHSGAYESERELATERDGIEFLIEDNGVRAVVDPGRARIASIPDHETTSMAAFDANPPQRALLERLHLIQRDWFNTRRLIYREAVLEVDEWITVLGAGTLEVDPDAPTTGLYRDGPPLRLRFTGTRRHPLAISDDPRSL